MICVQHFSPADFKRVPVNNDSNDCGSSDLQLGISRSGLKGLGLHLSGIVCSFRLFFRASRDTEALAVWYCLFVSSVLFGHGEGYWGSSCLVLPVLLVCFFRASRDTGIQLPGIIVYRLFLLSVLGPRGILGLQLSGIVGYCLLFLSVLFGHRGTLELQLSGIVCSVCLFCLS